MKNPTLKQFNRVIRNLRRIEEQANAENAFNIDEGDVCSSYHECGSVHCVAGWYAVSQKYTKNIAPLIKRQMCDYTDGSHLMVTHLGGEGKGRLAEWARNHPELWGNTKGGWLFTSVVAYEHLTPSSKNPMTLVIKHWENVRDRVHTPPSTKEVIL